MLKGLAHKRTQNNMEIGFTGTQRGMTYEQGDAVRIILKLNNCAAFHHGDCVGADAQAHDIARRFGCRVILHPPVNDAKRAFRHGDEARPQKDYLDRNKDIVNETELLIATPGEDDEQLRSGTWSTVRYARKLKRRIIIVFPDGGVKHENREEPRS